MRWRDQQEVLDRAVRARLEGNAEQGRMRDDVSIDTLVLYLETFRDGFINRL